MTTTSSFGTIELIGQYVRDLSFEHPDAPHSLNYAHAATPEADVQVTFRQLDASLFEVLLTISASAKTKDVTVAVIELSYAGTYRLPPIAAELREAFLLVDAPRDLFPFARALIGLVTQAAGIPPLLISAPNFAEVYRISNENKVSAKSAGAAV